MIKILLVLVSILYFQEFKDWATNITTLHSFRESILTMPKKVNKIFKKINKTIFLSDQEYVDLKTNLQKIDLHRNFASEKSGARIVSKSKGIKHVSSLIGKNKYNTGMLFDCGMITEQTPAIVIIDLTEDFYMKEIFTVYKSVYTNAVKDFRIYSSLDPVEGRWIEIGKFTNNKSRLFSHFHIQNDILTRYLKLEILSTYGDHKEFYCSMSEMRVFGKTITSFTQKRNENILKLNKEIDTMKESTKPEFTNFSNLKRNKEAENIVGNSETCPNKHFREIFYIKTQKAKPEKFLDPYFELYDYLFNNIKNLQLNVNTLLQNVSNEKKLETNSHPLRSYLQTFIKDRYQILKRMKMMEEKVDEIADKTKYYNRVHFLENRITKLKIKLSQNRQQSERSIFEANHRIMKLENRIEKLDKNWNIFVGVVFGILTFGFFCAIVVILRMNKKSKSLEKNSEEGNIRQRVSFKEDLNAFSEDHLPSDDTIEKKKFREDIKTSSIDENKTKGNFK